MESIAFFEKKISLTPIDFNTVKSKSIDDILLEKAKEIMESKCSEHGFVLPGFLELLSRSIGRFEDGNKTGNATYYVKLKAKIVYPADGIRVIGKVIRKNKMGLYVKYKKAIRIQVPRDFHVGSEEYESVEVGDIIEVELKRSKFQINDPHILASGIFISKRSEETEEPVEQVEQVEQVETVEPKEQNEEEEEEEEAEAEEAKEEEEAEAEEEESTEQNDSEQNNSTEQNESEESTEQNDSTEKNEPEEPKE